MPGRNANSDLLNALDESIVDVRAGRKTIEQCVQDFPQHRSELQVLLPVAATIVPTPVVPDPGRKLRARVELVEELHRQRAKVGVLGAVGALQRRLAGVALAVLLGIGGSGAAVVAAQDAQPHDALYGLKTAIEEQQVALVGSPDARAQLRVRFAERRLAEAERALAEGREEVAVAAAAGYAEAMQRAYDEIAAARAQGKPVAPVSEAAEDTAARLQEVATKAGIRGDQSAAAALLDAGERAERERTSTRRIPTELAAARDLPPVAGRTSMDPPVVLESEPPPDLVDDRPAADGVTTTQSEPGEPGDVTASPPAAEPIQGDQDESVPVASSPVRVAPSVPTGQGQTENRRDQPEAQATQRDERDDEEREDRDVDRGRGRAQRDEDDDRGGPQGRGNASVQSVATPTPTPTSTPTPSRTAQPTPTQREQRDGPGGRGADGQTRQNGESGPGAVPLPRSGPSGDNRPGPAPTLAPRPLPNSQVGPTSVPARGGSTGNSGGGSGQRGDERPRRSELTGS